MTKSILDIRPATSVAEVVAEVTEALDLLRRVEGAPASLETPHNIMLIEETLTDGSKAYSIRIAPRSWIPGKAHLPR